MGVPGFFIWLIKKYDNIILDKLDVPIDYLYLDANCLIHPQTQKVLSKFFKWTDKDDIEEKMLDQIEEYIDYLVDTVQPQELLYIAVDGVAPCAKIKHQRMRRFKSIKYKSQINSIKRKHGVDYGKRWDNAAITPGTEFMMKITKRMEHIVDTKYKNIKVIFSSGSIPGEGEHKILQHINLIKNDGSKSKKIVIYGLDADLIFLGLASHKRDVFLLREVQHFGKICMKVGEENIELLNYLSIDELRSKLCDEIKNMLCTNIENNNTNIVNDFIFMCYFIGNDFLAQIPMLNIKYGGLDIIMDAYTKIFDGEHFLHTIKGVEINKQFLLKFLKELSSVEEKVLRERYENPVRKRRCFLEDPYEIAVFKLDHIHFHVKDPVKLGKDTPKKWKARYYKHYFGEEDVYKICKNYFDGLQWTSKYYLKKCCSWSWYYPYTHAPMISDLYDYLKNNIDYQPKFEKNKPLDPFIQLLSVLHPSCNYLLPRHLRYLMISKQSPIIKMYPKIFNEDLIGKDMLWKGIPLLPKLDIKKIKKSVTYKYISDQDMIRNKKTKLYKNF